VTFAIGIGVRRLAYTVGSPGWPTYAVLGLVLLGACVALWLAASSDRSRGDDSPDADWGGGRRGPVGGPTPPPAPPDLEPEWWPEFEREFAAYAERSLVRT
jgi:hypothetical protein